MITVTFEHLGKTYKGTFTQPFQDPDSWWLRADTGTYLGRLYRFPDRWEFYDEVRENKLSELVDFFKDYLIAWYQ